MTNTAVPTISIYSTYRQLHCCFTRSNTHNIYIQNVPSVALLFHTQQYPPYLYTVRTVSCTAVSHTAGPTISIYRTYRQLHFCFTHSSTHHFYIQYVPTVALLFHTQQFPPYLCTVRTDICTAVYTQQYPPFLYTLCTDSCTTVSHTVVPSIFIYSTYRQLHCCFRHSSSHHIHIQYVLTVALLFHTQQ
jgi:hypothetical protein